MSSLATAFAPVVAPVLAGAAAALLIRGHPHPRPRTSASAEGRLLVGVGAGVTGLVLVADGTLLVLGLLGLASGAAVVRLVARIRARAVADERRSRVAEVAQAVAGELAAGQPPVRALAHAAEGWEPLTPVVQAGRLGADVPAALRRVADQPGAEGLRDVAAAWRMAEGTGAGLALALSQVAEATRQRESTDRMVAAELASARATARLLAALPVLVLVLGSGLGGDPWAFLLGSPVGLVCLGTGLCLLLVGLSWIERIAAAVTQR